MKTLLITASLLAATIAGSQAANDLKRQNDRTVSVEITNLADKEKGKGKCDDNCEKCKGGGKGKGGGCKGGCKGKGKEE